MNYFPKSYKQLVIAIQSLDEPVDTQEQCCIDGGVSQECLVLCRKDPNYDYDSNDDDTKFPNDTPCEKHKPTIHKCWRDAGTFNAN